MKITKKKIKAPQRVKSKSATFPSVPKQESFSRENSSADKGATKALALVDPLTAYIAEIRKYPLLTRKEERELTQRYHDTKDPHAAEILVTSNLRFVVKIAAEYSKFGAKLIDLIQEGNIGLMHAVREFNPFRGVRLITYAVWWIRGYIQEYLMRQYSVVRIGTTHAQRKLFYQLQKQKEALEAMGETADLARLSSRLGVSEADVQMMEQRLSSRDLSLDKPIDQNSSQTFLDMQSGTDEKTIDEQLEISQQIKLLRDRIDLIRPQLKDREIFVLEHRLLADEPMTLQEIGDRYGITREAVRQMEAKLLEKIKSAF